MIALYSHLLVAHMCLFAMFPQLGSVEFNRCLLSMPKINKDRTPFDFYVIEDLKNQRKKFNYFFLTGPLKKKNINTFPVILTMGLFPPNGFFLLSRFSLES